MFKKNRKYLLVLGLAVLAVLSVVFLTGSHVLAAQGPNPGAPNGPSGPFGPNGPNRPTTIPQPPAPVPPAPVPISPSVAPATTTCPNVQITLIKDGQILSIDFLELTKPAGAIWDFGDIRDRISKIEFTFSEPMVLEQTEEIVDDTYFWNPKYGLSKINWRQNKQETTCKIAFDFAP